MHFKTIISIFSISIYEQELNIRQVEGTPNCLQTTVELFKVQKLKFDFGNQLNENKQNVLGLYT